MNEEEIYKVSGVTLVLKQMPEDEQMEIMGRGDRQTDDRWFLGDKANEWAERVREKLLPCSVMDVYDTIAYLYGDGVVGRTIRYYSEIAYFYPQWVRDEYDVLPWSHFDLAKRYRDDEWQAVLEMAVEYMDTHNGKRPTRRWLEACLAGTLYEKQAEEFDHALPSEPEAEILTANNALEYDLLEEPKSFKADTIKTALKFVRTLGNHMERIPVSDYLRSRLVFALEELDEILDEVLDTMI